MPSVDKKCKIRKSPGVEATNSSLGRTPNRSFLLAGLYCSLVDLCFSSFFFVLLNMSCSSWRVASYSWWCLLFGLFGLFLCFTCRIASGLQPRCVSILAQARGVFFLPLFGLPLLFVLFFGVFVIACFTRICVCFLFLSFCSFLSFFSCLFQCIHEMLKCVCCACRVQDDDMPLRCVPP